jgi:hypothetical protein
VSITTMPEIFRVAGYEGARPLKRVMQKELQDRSPSAFFWARSSTARP